ncbi:hypothetical protein HNP48_002701 [Acidovorax soli]|uniref:Phosphotransferase enzyme family protein n=1 Tax=Acidovorax soli TaxID=592050 RepID=A0A7X0PE87_9BURK|nr:hypothetical protein [Acidovorax soli]MBB6560029.1 hypothetical protein [Acidovorax soli]
MRDTNIDHLLEVGAARLALQLGKGARKYGWNRKSVGCAATDSSGQWVWVKVFGKCSDSTESKLWDGEILASEVFRQVHKPKVLSHVDWCDSGWTWRCLVMELIQEPMLSETPNLPPWSVLPEGWAGRVFSAMQQIATHTTERVGVRQDLVTRRIAETFGAQVPSKVESWVAGHNDLHFANISARTACILDWESWGTVPQGFDAAWLYCNSLANRHASRAIYEALEPLLVGYSGALSLLFAAAELKRMYQLHGEHSAIQRSLEQVAEQALRELA